MSSSLGYKTPKKPKPPDPNPKLKIGIGLNSWENVQYKKKWQKTHGTCRQYINLKIETIYRFIGPWVKKLLMLKVAVGLFCPPPLYL